MASPPPKQARASVRCISQLLQAVGVGACTHAHGWLGAGCVLRHMRTCLAACAHTLLRFIKLLERFRVQIRLHPPNIEGGARSTHAVICTAYYAGVGCGVDPLANIDPLIGDCNPEDSTLVCRAHPCSGCPWPRLGGSGCPRNVLQLQAAVQCACAVRLDRRTNTAPRIDTDLSHFSASPANYLSPSHTSQSQS